MTWIYNQKDGSFYHDEEFEGTGYSGTGAGRNNPDLERIPGVGPIPIGVYDIGPAYPHPRLGVLTMNLVPCSGTECFGRDYFRIHGNNKLNDASHGCIVLGPAIREKIAKSNDRTLHVV